MTVKPKEAFEAGEDEGLTFRLWDLGADRGAPQMTHLAAWAQLSKPFLVTVEIECVSIWRPISCSLWTCLHAVSLSNAEPELPSPHHT